MLLTLGYVLAGVMLYDYVIKEDSPSSETTDQSTTYLMKSGKGELTLPPCRLMAVELGPFAEVTKVTLMIMDEECKPVDVGKEKRYVKLTPTHDQYELNVILRTKRKSLVPITAYYKI